MMTQNPEFNKQDKLYKNCHKLDKFREFPGGPVVKTWCFHCQVQSLVKELRPPRDVDLIPEAGRSPVEGNVNPLQHSCLENSMDRGAWRATVRGATESWT